ncbi:MAG: IS21 family transposase, partial [Gemmatimonadaceae bacterium]
MRKVLDILRLAHEGGRGQREIAASLSVSQSTVSECLSRFRASGLSWPLAGAIDEAMLEARLFVRPMIPTAADRPLPDWATIHRELKRTGVTLQLLWVEYQQAHEGTPERRRCYQYTQFCAHYHAWAATLDPVLRQDHKAGERTFVDYAGPHMEVLDLETGELREAQIFVGALGASHLLFAEATWIQQLPDWIASHVRMAEFYGGVTALTVPDNLKTGVTHACFYEPELNATYHDWATHYGTVILPTRAAKPRDKAKVEGWVLIIEREVMAPLRNHRFTSLAALNAGIAERLAIVNARPFQLLAGSRRSVFDTLERPTLRPLPAERYEFAEWKTATVHIDYHVAVEKHFYSVPH